LNPVGLIVAWQITAMPRIYAQEFYSLSYSLERDRTQNRRPVLLIAPWSYGRMRRNGGVVLITG
ncbi:MAG: hypothetical protein Q8L13_04900, partial [Bradyrhizobium sp.]|uniref:hypothetical protein n=1 Tax=Bradyrhizobium sp. TaxID=376 RepID=UPI002731C836